jgi:hypothetical protein
MKCHLVRVKIIAVLLETLMVIPHSLNQVADEQHRLVGRGYDGCVVHVEDSLDMVQG